MSRFLAFGFCLCFGFALTSPLLGAQASGGKSDGGDDGPDGLMALKHPNPQIRFNAVELLGKLGKNAKFAVPDLRELLKDPNVSVRIKTVESLWKIEQPDAKPLLAVLLPEMDHKEDIVRVTVLNVLSQMGEKSKPALPAVKKALKDKAFSVRWQAILTTGAIGPLAKDAVPELLDLMREDDTGFLEAQVAIALSKVGAGAVPALRKGLTDKSLKVRRGSAFALGLLGPKAYESVPDLAKALKDVEPVVRAIAAEALGKIGAEAEPALADLTKALKDKDVPVRVNAALAMWQIAKNKHGLDVLADAAVKGPDGLTRQSAIVALAEFGPAAKPALPKLFAALEDKDEDVRRQSVIALGKMGTTVENASKLFPLLEDKSRAVRLQSVLSIWKIESKFSIKGQKVVEEGLQQEEAATLLLAVHVLDEIGPAAKKVVPALLPLLKHSDKAVRLAAMNALQKIDPQVTPKKG